MTERNINKIYIKYYQGTTQQSRNAVKNTVAHFQKRAGKNCEFLNGYTFSVVNKFQDLSADTPWKKFIKLTSDKHGNAWGITNPTVVDGEKSVVIQAKKHSSDKNIFNANTDPKLLESATLHEIGHIFDNYFGKKNDKLVEIVKNFHIYSNLSLTEKQILKKYLRHKDLSDSDEFKQAWLKDATALGKDKKKYEEFKNNNVRRYYAINEIDITDGITKQEIEYADKARSEIFAQLFAYALGKDDGHKDEIIKVYPNTYKYVQNCIKDYLEIKL